jgi:hypothetical protein
MIFSSASTGTHEIHGDIWQRWVNVTAGITWAAFVIGFPTDDEQDFPQGGRVSYFEKQTMYWWPDTGVKMLRGKDVRVSYKGLVAWKSTGDKLFAPSDEAIVTIGTVTPLLYDTYQSGEYGSTDSGDYRTADVELYRGEPGGMDIATLVMEHDETDPRVYRRAVQYAVVAAAGTVSISVATLPPIGPLLALGAVEALAFASFELGNAVNDLLDSADDRIGTAVDYLTAKDMVLLADAASSTVKNAISYKFSTEHLTRENADYQVYYSVDVV